MSYALYTPSSRRIATIALHHSHTLHLPAGGSPDRSYNRSGHLERVHSEGIKTTQTHTRRVDHNLCIQLKCYLKPFETIPCTLQ